MITKGHYPDIAWVLNEWGEFPTKFSDNACRIISDHYFTEGETSFFDVVKRVVETITNAGSVQGHINVHEMELYAVRLGGYLLRQEAAFNSPVYYNLGVREEPQCSACFIQSVEDTMEDILDLAKKEGLLFKWGSGTGTNLSTLRHAGAPLSGGGEASGPLAFMRMYDSVASTIKSGGRTRRAAKMVLLDCDHPDIEAFIDCKVVEDRKARRLIAAGMDPVEAYDSVQYQNGNNSVRLTDDFMRAATLEEGMIPADRAQYSNGKESKQLDKIAKAAWECGDPGVQFTDTINRAHQVPEAGPINASNPCSEFVFLDETACNLASINVVKYVKKDPRQRKQIVEDFIVAMDIIVDFAGYPTKKIEENSKKYRPLGLGFTNLAAYLMSQGFRYGDEDSLKYAAALAEEIQLHADNASRALADFLGSPWGGEYRNAQRTLVAPTGTISFMMDCESTGIEPVFAEEQTKHLSGKDETLTIVPDCIRDATEYAKVTAIGKNVVTPMEHIEMMAAVQPHLCGAISKTVNVPHEWTWEQIRELYVEAWKRGLKCIAVYRDGSKGIQALTKKDDSPPLNEQTLREAVDKMRGSIEEGGPVLDKKKLWWVGETIEEPAPPKVISQREKLPDIRESVTHKFEIGGTSGYLTVGMYPDGRPGELFVNIAKEGSTLGGLCDAWATSVSLLLQNGVSLETVVEKFKGSRFDPAGFTSSPDVRSATSIVDYIANWLDARFADKREHNADAVVGDGDAGDRDGAYHGNTCPSCGAPTIRSGTCESCPSCGETTGCG